MIDKQVKDFELHIVDFDDFIISYQFDQFELNKVLNNLYNTL